jgi:hypothetical protein
MLSGLAAGLATPAAAADPPVVLELFTSQGCSSCPPADALLGELAQRPNVIALAWHVDYWNALGWRDPFASQHWTERQTGYAMHLRNEVYTPALVVNGASMVVGSDRVAVRAAIGKAPALSVPASLRRTAAGLEAEIGSTPEPMTRLLAIYDPDRQTDIGSGENGGRRLREYCIVRELHPIVTDAGTVTLPAIQGTQGAVLLLQDANWRVCGAADLRPA